MPSVHSILGKGFCNVSSEYILELEGIEKHFPGVRPKRRFVKGSTGNGAYINGRNGKSTLMKCLIGYQKPTAGKIIFDGKEVEFTSTLQAMNAGISMIHQELSPVLERTVCDDVWMGREPRVGPIVNEKKMYSDCAELFQRLELDLDPSAKMGELTVAKMQMSKLRKLYLDGEYITSDRAENMNVDQVISLMVGREVNAMFPKEVCPIGETILKVEDLSSGKSFSNVSFELRSGEILGFAGLVGAGRTEIVETIFGMRPKTSGTIFKDGKVCSQIPTFLLLTNPRVA